MKTAIERVLELESELDALRQQLAEAQTWYKNALDHWHAEAEMLMTKLVDAQTNLKSCQSQLAAAREASNDILRETYESANGKCLSCAGANEIASRALQMRSSIHPPQVEQSPASKVRCEHVIDGWRCNLAIGHLGLHSNSHGTFWASSKSEQPRTAGEQTQQWKCACGWIGCDLMQSEVHQYHQRFHSKQGTICNALPKPIAEAGERSTKEKEL